MMSQAAVVSAAIAVLVLAGCTTGQPVAMPTPDSSPSASPLGTGPDQGWLIEAQNGYLTASTRLCSDEGAEVLSASAEFGSITLEENGGLPDLWVPGDEYVLDVNTIFLNLEGGTYFAERFDGDVTSGIGTSWETPNGPLVVERDADGFVTGGSGTGETRIIDVNGDVERQDDVVTFSVSVIDEPPWCDLL